jgi:hypothetical protein
MLELCRGPAPKVDGFVVSSPSFLQERLPDLRGNEGAYTESLRTAPQVGVGPSAWSLHSDMNRNS